MTLLQSREKGYFQLGRRSSNKVQKFKVCPSLTPRRPGESHEHPEEEKLLHVATCGEPSRRREHQSKESL